MKFSDLHCGDQNYFSKAEKVFDTIFGYETKHKLLSKHPKDLTILEWDAAFDKSFKMVFEDLKNKGVISSKKPGELNYTTLYTGIMKGNNLAIEPK